LLDEFNKPAWGQKTTKITKKFFTPPK
jgi:hypothetical protein